MKVYFLSYAANNAYYYNRQQILKGMAQQERFDGVLSITDKELKETGFYRDNADILDLQRGAGYWIWKPYIILQSLNFIDEGDTIFYLDCGDTFKSGIKNKIQELLKDRDMVISTSFFSQKAYTKRDCFDLMDCDSEEFWDAHQVEAGIVAFKKNIKTVSFIEEWLKFSLDKNIVTDLANICGKSNFKDFIDHRHDQSILTNLCTKYNIKLQNSIRKFAGVSDQDIDNYPDVT